MYNKLPCKECPHGVNGVCKIENCRLWFDYIKRDKEERELLKKYIERRNQNEVQKKPVVINAVKWDGDNLEEVKEFVGEQLIYSICDTAWQVGKGKPHVLMYIKTLEGNMTVTEGDYIIKGIKGEFYPCKPDIFEGTYEKETL